MTEFREGDAHRYNPGMTPEQIQLWCQRANQAYEGHRERGVDDQRATLMAIKEANTLIRPVADHAKVLAGMGYTGDHAKEIAEEMAAGDVEDIQEGY